MNSAEHSCILCGSDAAVSETDQGNRKYVQCSNPDCGNYEISRAAEKDVAENEHVRQRLSAKARSCRSGGEILRIAVGDDGNLMAACAAEPRD